MDELVSGIIRRSDSFGKNEEDGQRVKRRRMMRKCHLDGESVTGDESSAEPDHCSTYDL
jgi:hypothetical protein